MHVYILVCVFVFPFALYSLWKSSVTISCLELMHALGMSAYMFESSVDFCSSCAKSDASIYCVEYSQYFLMRGHMIGLLYLLLQSFYVYFLLWADVFWIVGAVYVVSVFHSNWPLSVAGRGSKSMHVSLRFWVGKNRLFPQGRKADKSYTFLSQWFIHLSQFSFLSGSVPPWSVRKLEVYALFPIQCLFGGYENG